MGKRNVLSEVLLAAGAEFPGNFVEASAEGTLYDKST
jgi:hypothetical protein